MKYQCVDCGNIFGDDEVKQIEEARGEFWGQPVKETVSVCPYCCGDFEEYEESEDEEE